MSEPKQIGFNDRAAHELFFALYRGPAEVPLGLAVVKRR